MGSFLAYNPNCLSFLGMREVLLSRKKIFFSSSGKKSLSFEREKRGKRRVWDLFF